MIVDMNLVRADPILQLTPHLMEEAEQGNLDLKDYIALLLKDLAGDPNPFRHALSLVEEGNVSLARRFIRGHVMSEQEMGQFEQACQQVATTTVDLGSQVDAQILQISHILGSTLSDRYLSLQSTYRAAIQQERYHIAQRDLLAIHDILSHAQTSVSEQISKPVEALDLIDKTIEAGSILLQDQTAPTTETPLFETTIEEHVPLTEVKPIDPLDLALVVWNEVTAQMSIPLRAWLKPNDKSVKPLNYIEARLILQQSQQIEEGWQQKSSDTIKQYFYLDAGDRSQLEDVFWQTVVIYALERMKEHISYYKDLDTANLIYEDILRALKARSQLRFSDQVVYDICRYSVEINAALWAKDLNLSFRDFDTALSTLLRSFPLHLGRNKTLQMVGYGKVMFFHYRIQTYGEDHQSLIQFYTEHHTSIDGLVRGDIELNRFLEIAKSKYNDALYKKAENELTGLELPEGMKLAETPQFLRSLAPYQIVPALKSIRSKFVDRGTDTSAMLLYIYDLVLLLFDMQRPEELVFARENISNLVGVIRTNVPTGNEYFQVGLVGDEKLSMGVLDTLEKFVNKAIDAVSTTDLMLARQSIAYALDDLREQRKYLRDTNPALRYLWHMLGDHWISLLVAMQRAMSRKTSLVLELQSTEVIANEESSLVVYVRNEGRNTARQIEIALTSSDLTIRSGIHRCQILGEGDEASFSFLVIPRLSGQHSEVRILVRYVDPDDNPIIFSENRAITPLSLGARRIPAKSPYVWGQPLDKDSKVFLGREDVFEFLQTRFWGEERNKIIALQGERRMGKTSILNQLESRKVFSNYRIVMFDFQGRYANIDAMYEFLYHFARRIRSEAKLPAELQVDRSEFIVSAREYYDAFEQWLDRVEQELEQRDTQIVILFDEFEKLLSRRFDDSVTINARFAEELLQYLRLLMLTRKRLNWVIAGSWSLVAKQRDYFSSLFGMTISYWVSYLKRNEAVALIQEPVKDYFVYEQDAIERILRLTGGHPFYIQIICDEIYSRAQKLNLRRIYLSDVNRIVGEALPQVTETSFRTNWTSLTDLTARKVLAAVAEAMQGPSEYIYKKNVLNYLHRKSPGFDEDQFYSALDIENGELIRRELVEVHPGESERIRVRSELLYHWLRKSKSLANVLREER